MSDDTGEDKSPVNSSENNAGEKLLVNSSEGTSEERTPVNFQGNIQISVNIGDTRSESDDEEGGRDGRESNDSARRGGESDNSARGGGESDNSTRRGESNNSARGDDKRTSASSDYPPAPENSQTARNQPEDKPYPRRDPERPPVESSKPEDATPTASPHRPQPVEGPAPNANGIESSQVSHESFAYCLHVYLKIPDTTDQEEPGSFVMNNMTYVPYNVTCYDGYNPMEDIYGDRDEG